MPPQLLCRNKSGEIYRKIGYSKTTCMKMEVLSDSLAIFQDLEGGKKKRRESGTDESSHHRVSLCPAHFVFALVS